MTLLRHVLTSAAGVAIISAVSVVPYPAFAQIPDCDQIETALGGDTHAALSSALSASAVVIDNGGFNLNMWATIVDRDGNVCAVTFTGNNRGDQWPGSRVISAQKANTANAFSLPGLALSTANLFSAVQPGGSLFGLQHSNPVDTEAAYEGDSEDNGTESDPLEGEKIGGVNVFGGGLALYDSDDTLLGAVGVSGDSSCADHNIAWRVRDTLGLDYVPAGVRNGGVNEGNGDDNMIFDIADDAGSNPESAGGFGHPTCGVGADDSADNAAIVAVCPVGDGMSPDCLDDVLNP